MNDAIEHITRSAPPWRDAQGLTECGRSVNDVAAVISRDQAIRKFKDLGKTRAAMTTCITCCQTVNRSTTWEQDPVKAMHRETSVYKPEEIAQLRDELTAIALLIERHRADFNEIRAGLHETVRLADRRRRRV